MNILKTNKWLQLSLLNFFVVAVLGVLMRYKIGFEFPFFNQKNLQHAHSHFALAAWISQTLMVLMIEAISVHFTSKRQKIYDFVLIINQISAVGMLLSFVGQGYGLFSIAFSSVSLFISLFFSVLYAQDLLKLTQEKSRLWFFAALVFNALSVLGTVNLIYMMVSKNLDQHSYLASVYWYLHFQYNGWFFFASMGLFSYFLKGETQFGLPSFLFWIWAVSCVPAFGLSVLWMQLNDLAFWVVVLAGLAQLGAWLAFLAHVFRLKLKIGAVAKFLLFFVGIALSVKWSLQAASVIPALSKLAFGFRPIVIAYMHLIFLGIFTMFLISYAYLRGFWKVNRLFYWGLGMLASGVFLNELVLAIQGIASLSYTLVPAVNEILFGVSLLLLLSIALILASQKFVKSYDHSHKSF
jgi:hypothetical protein